MNDGYLNKELKIFPENWEVRHLDNLIEENTTISYGVVQPGPEVENGILFIRGGDIKNGKISKNLRTISENVSRQYSRTLIKGGELLISLVGYPGECAIVPDYLKGANIARQVGLVKINKRINADYVQQYLSSSIGKKNLLDNLVGSAQQVINLDKLRKVKIPIPPFLEQQKISLILRTVDEKIEIIKEKLVLTEDLSKGLMQQLLTKGIGHTKFKTSPLGDIPVSWDVCKLSDIAEVTSSKRVLQSDYVEFGIPFYRGKEITMKSKGKEVDDIVYISEIQFNELSEKYGAPKAGDILVTAVGTIGSVYLVEEKEIFYFKDGNLIWLKNIKPEVDKSYLKFYLKSNSCQNLISILSSGSSQKALTIIKLSLLDVLLPPLNEQKSIAELFGMVSLKLDTLNSKLCQYKKLKEGLMLNLFTGKMSVKSILFE